MSSGVLLVNGGNTSVPDSTVFQVPFDSTPSGDLSDLSMTTDSNSNQSVFVNGSDFCLITASMLMTVSHDTYVTVQIGKAGVGLNTETVALWEGLVTSANAVTATLSGVVDPTFATQNAVKIYAPLGPGVTMQVGLRFAQMAVVGGF